MPITTVAHSATPATTTATTTTTTTNTGAVATATTTAARGPTTTIPTSMTTLERGFECVQLGLLLRCKPCFAGIEVVVRVTTIPTPADTHSDTHTAMTEATRLLPSARTGASASASPVRVPFRAVVVSCAVTPTTSSSAAPETHEGLWFALPVLWVPGPGPGPGPKLFGLVTTVNESKIRSTTLDVNLD